MKRTVIFILIIMGLFQTDALSQVISKPKAVSNAISLSLPDINLKYSALALKLGGFKIQDSKSLFVYNKNTGANDIYQLVGTSDNEGWQYKKGGSVVLPENKFRSNKIDSFNPHGADSVPQALLIGAINLLFF